MTKTNIDASGNDPRNEESDLADSYKGRCIGVSPDGVYVICGFKDGTLRVINNYPLIFRFLIKN